MPELAITITNYTEADYDGVDEDIKVITGTINGIKLTERCSCESTETDAECKTSFKNLLTAKGFTWTTES